MFFMPHTRFCVCLLFVLFSFVNIFQECLRAEDRPITASKLSEEEWKLFQEFQRCYYQNALWLDNVNFRGKEIIKRENNIEKENNDSVIDVEFWSNGGKYFRMDIFPFSRETSQPRRVAMSGPIGEIVAFRKDITDRFTVERYNTSPPPAEGRFDVMSEFGFLFAPYSCHFSWLKYLIVPPPGRDPTYFIDSIALSEENGEQIATMHCSTSSKAFQESISFLKDKNWFVRRWRISSEDQPDYKTIFMGECDYAYFGDTFFLSNYTVTSGLEDKQGNFFQSDHTHFSTEKVVPGSVPLEYFDPEKVLGIKIGSQKANWTFRLILLLIGGLFMVFYFIIHRKQVKSEITKE